VSALIECTGPHTRRVCSKGGRCWQLFATAHSGWCGPCQAVCSKSPRGSRHACSMGRISIRKHWKHSRAICTVASATCNSNVLLHGQRLIVEVVHGVAAETVSRRRRHRTWQGAVNVEQRVSVQMRSDAVVQSSLGCEVEDAFERDDREHRAAVVEPVNLSVRACVGDRMLGECPIGMQTLALRHREVPAVGLSVRDGWVKVGKVV